MIVLSARHQTIDLRLLGRSSIEIRKRMGTIIEPWGISQSEYILLHANMFYADTFMQSFHTIPHIKKHKIIFFKNIIFVHFLVQLASQNANASASSPVSASHLYFCSLRMQSAVRHVRSFFFLFYPTCNIIVMATL